MRTNRNNRYPVPVNHNRRKPGFVSSIARALGIGGALGVGSALGDEVGGGLFNDEPPYEPLDPVEPFPLEPEPYVVDLYPDGQEPVEPYDPGYEDPYNAGSDFPDEDEDDDFPDDEEGGGFSDCGDHMDINPFDMG